MSVWFGLGLLLFSILFLFLKGRAKSIAILVFCWGWAAVWAVNFCHDYRKWAACTSLHDVAELKPFYAGFARGDGIAIVVFLVLSFIWYRYELRKTRRASGAGPGVEKPS